MADIFKNSGDDSFINTGDDSFAGGINQMTATGITTGAPVLGAPVIGQPNTMIATGITTGAPVLGSPTIVDVPKVQTPAILPAAGGYPAGTQITITCATSGASIYYTTDGLTPDSGSTLYSALFLLSGDITVKAIGIKAGAADSDIATTIFTLALAAGKGVASRINEPPRAELVLDSSGRISRIWHDFFVNLMAYINVVASIQSGNAFDSGGGGSGSGSGGGDGMSAGISLQALLGGQSGGREILDEITGLLFDSRAVRQQEIIDVLFDAKTSQNAEVVPVLDSDGYFIGKNVEAILAELGETRRENGWDLLDTDSMADIAFTSGTRTFTASVKGGQSSYHFWVHSQKIIKTGDETVVIPDVTGTYYIIFDETGTLTAVAKDSLVPDDFYEHAITGLIYWNAAQGEGMVGDERHGKTMDSRTHHYNHVTFGARYQPPGLAITGLVVGNPTYTNTTSGHFWDEDIQHTIALQATHKFLYREGTDGAWRATADDNEVSYIDGADIYASWNEWTGATWQLTEGGPTTDFWNIFLVALPNIDGYTVRKVIGQNAFANRAAAQAAMETALIDLSTSGLPNEEFIFLAAFIVDRDGDLIALGDGSTHLDLRSLKGGSSGASGAAAYAADVATVVTNFDKGLSSADTDVQKALDTLNDNTLPAAQQTATGDGTTTIDWTLGGKSKFTFGAFNEVFTFTAPSAPCNLVLMLIQDGVGGRTATWPATVKWVGGAAPTLTTGAGTIDIVRLYFDGTNYYAKADLAFA